jgi:uncharacterized protein (TIGR02145 family)
MKTTFLSLALILMLVWADAQPGYISNIQVTQGTGVYQRVLDIYFDLSGSDLLYYVSLEISFDNGISYDPVDPAEVSGPLTVSPGIGIHLVWDGRLSYPAFTSDVSRLKIIATTWQCGNPITDSRDGQIYNTVQIGSQCWMAENLNVGTMVVSPSPLTQNGVIEKYCFDNLTENCNDYGGLYTWLEMINWNAMADPHGICPSGWHIPTDEEWKQLEGEADSFIDYPDPIWNNYDYRGLDAGANLKEAGNTHWAEPNVATNSTGLSLLPGGGLYDLSDFREFHYYGHYWSSTPNDMGTAFYRAFDFNRGESRRFYWSYNTGMSVRCLKDAESVDPPPPTWSCGDPLNDTRDNQTYNTIDIAGQCWMAENLNIGTKLDSTFTPSDNGEIEKHCYHDQDSYCEIYGGLYPWREMMEYSNIEGAQGICPDGWHLPTWNEWWNMIYYVGENIGECCEPGGKLKESGYEHWVEPNTGATNETGFTALPGGSFLSGNAYSYMGYTGKFWSSREFYPTTRAGSFSLAYDTESIMSSTVTNKFNEFSVRCIKGQGGNGNGNEE